jgi:pimeloyl-ACP methyl ester carboxylesterase
MRIAIVAIAAAAVVVIVFLVRSCGGPADDSGAALTDQAATEEPAAAGAVAGPPGPDGRLVDVGGHRLFIQSFGDGSPSVVIEPGIGDAGRVWGSVIDALSDETRVVLYARAGYGRSDAGPMPRGADRVVRELTSLLVATPVDPPYVVVGHSIGAINALLYASQHPNLVAGLVLLDPPPLGFIKGERFPRLQVQAEQMTAGFRREAQRAREAGNEREAVFYETIASEHEMMFDSGWTWVASVGSLGDMPLVVVGSGVPNPEFGEDAEEFQEYWRESSEALSWLSTRGRFVFAENSTHDLPGDAPGVVAEAVRYCIAESEIVPEDAIWQGEK